MHVLTKIRIVEAIEKYPQAESALKSWYLLMKKSEPKDFAELKTLFPAVDRVGKFHVFDIGGNKIRLIAFVRFRGKKCYIRQILSHQEYDKNKWKEE